MNSRQTKTLQDLGNFYKGTGIPRDSSNSGELPAVRYGELYTDYDTFISEKTRSKISEVIAKDAFKMEYGDILLAGSGETPEDIGKSAVFLLDEGYAGGDIIVFRPDKTKVNPKFLALYFETEPWKKQRRRVAQGQSIVHIHTTDLKKMIIELPNLETQQKIVQILDCIRNIIDYNNCFIEKSEELFRIIVKKLIHNTSGDVQLPFEKCYNVLPKIKGIKREQYQKTGKYPIIDQQKDRIISGRTDNEHLAIEMKKPCIVFGDHSRAVKYVDHGKHAFGNDGIKIISTKEILDDYYGYLSILNLDIPNTGYNRHFKYLKSTVFIIPEMTTQKQIANICLNIEGQIKMTKLKSLLFKNQYKYLLNHLISGDFDLTNIKLENRKEQQ